jgi:hypothetical protein
LPPSGGYPVGPVPGPHHQPASPQYALPATTGPHPTTQSSGAVYLVSSSAAFVSLTALIASAFLIN